MFGLPRKFHSEHIQQEKGEKGRGVSVGGGGGREDEENIDRVRERVKGQIHLRESKQEDLRCGNLIIAEVRVGVEYSERRM